MQDTLIRRAEAAKVLRKLGVQTSVYSLNAWACYGGGPTFTMKGRWSEYRLADLEEFARLRLAQQEAKRQARLAA